MNTGNNETYRIGQNSPPRTAMHRMTTDLSIAGSGSGLIGVKFPEKVRLVLMSAIADEDRNDYIRNAVIKQLMADGHIERGMTSFDIGGITFGTGGGYYNGIGGWGGGGGGSYNPK